MDNQKHLYQAMLKLFRRLEWSGKGKQYDTGDYQQICPVCLRAEADGQHRDDCELHGCIEALELLA